MRCGGVITTTTSTSLSVAPYASATSVDAFRHLRVGLPDEETTDVGPMIDPEAVSRVLSLIERDRRRTRGVQDSLGRLVQAAARTPPFLIIISQTMSPQTKTPSETRDASIQVVIKVGALLDGLAEVGESTASDLADRIGEPRSTVYRLLSTLQQLEMVEPGMRRGTYRLGLTLLRLGAEVAAGFDERRAALPVLERLHKETGETVFLCVRRGDEAVCIERLDGQRVQSLALRLGGSLPLHAGAAPRALLAFEPKERWEEYAAATDLEAFTPKTPVVRAALLRRLDETRSLGYAVSDEDVTIGIAALGAPVFDYRGKVCAAISISGVRSAILGDSADRLTESILEGAREISRTLGHKGGTNA